MYRLRLAVLVGLPLFIALMPLLSLHPCSRAADPPAAQNEPKRIAELIHLLASGNFQERQRAKKELIDAGAPALEPLRKALQSKDPEVVRSAEECLPLVERHIKIRGCIAALSDPDPKKRAEAANELLAFDTDAESAVPALLKVLDDPDAHVRMRAMVAIGFVGRNSTKAMPKLIQIVSDKKAADDFRARSVVALQNIGPAAEQAIPAILAGLATGESSLRVFSAHALGTLGCNNDQVLPALLKALKDPERSVRGAAAYALGTIGKEPSTCVPAILEALKKYEYQKGAGQDFSPPSRLIVALGMFGRHAKIAVPVLVDVANNREEDKYLRHQALEALQQIGPEAKDAVPALVQILKNRQEFDPLHGCIVLTLQYIGPAAKDAIPVLTEFAKTPGHELQEMAVQALKAIQGNPKKDP